MKKFITAAALVILALIFGSLVTPQASATESVANLAVKQGVAAAPASVQTSYHVPPITCQYPTSCVRAYYGNGSLQGYWMLKIANCTTCKWLRVSRVNGADWNNDYVAPITCEYEDSCEPGHWYSSWTDEGYDWLKRDGVVVRTSMLEQDGAVFQ